MGIGIEKNINRQSEVQAFDSRIMFTYSDLIIWSFGHGSYELYYKNRLTGYTGGRK